MKTTYRLACTITLSAAFCLLAIAPANAQPKGLIFAHRGGAHEFEENTLDAFKGTYAEGIRAYETDIRMTKDGVLVVLHDDSLDRTHNATGPVEDKTSEELKTVLSKKSPQTFLFLEELLNFLREHPCIYVEFEMKTSNKKLYPDDKIQAYTDAIYKQVLNNKPKDSIYVFTSFDDRPLKAIRAKDPNAELMYISGGPVSQEFVDKAKAIGVKRIGCRMERTSRKDVKDAQAQGMIVTGWPGHSIADYHLALGLGVDAICTDIPLQVQSYIEHSKTRKNEHAEK